jgi:hypothetical protein
MIGSAVQNVESQEAGSGLRSAPEPRQPPRPVGAGRHAGRLHTSFAVDVLDASIQHDNQPTSSLIPPSSAYTLRAGAAERRGGNVADPPNGRH